MKNARLITFVLGAIVQLGAFQEASATEVNYLWVYNPGSGYVNGKTFEESGAYCRSKGGALATKAQLVDANSKGFSMCAYGWLDGGVSGYVMAGAQAGCGRNGFNGGAKTAPDKKLGAYCVGPRAPLNSKNIQLAQSPANQPVRSPEPLVYGTTVAGAPVAKFEKNKYYYLSNRWLGTEKVLTLDAQSQFVMQAKSPSGNARQLWKMEHQQDGSIRIYNASTGTSSSVDSDRVKPTFRKTGNYSGQHWHFTHAGDGWFRISNNFQGKAKVLDTFNKPNNPLFFEDANKGSSGTFWKYQVHDSAITAQFTKEETTAITLSPTRPTEVKPTEPGITVVGCVNIPGIVDCRSPGHRSQDGSRTNYKVITPCLAKQSQSLLLHARGPLSHTDSPLLPHNDCFGRSSNSATNLSYFRTYSDEYEKVSAFFVQAEQEFLSALRENPSKVLNLEDKSVRETLVKTGGKVPFSYLTAYVQASLMGVAAIPKAERSVEQQAALEWILRGDYAVQSMMWGRAQQYYREWLSNPCAFKPPAAFKTRVADRTKETNRDLYANCGGGANPFNALNTITKTQQAHYDVQEFLEWGAADVGAKYLADSSEANAARDEALAAVLITGGAAAAITGGTLVLAGTAISAAIFTVSGMMVAKGLVFTAVTATGLTVVGPTLTAIGVSGVAGPAGIIVVAILGSAIATAITIEDVQFHEAMQNDQLSRPFNADPSVTYMTGEGLVGVTIAFNDALARQDPNRLIDITLPAHVYTVFRSNALQPRTTDDVNCPPHRQSCSPAK